jgi:hypothetical protein
LTANTFNTEACAPVPTDKVALSILEKLQVPEGWCSSGFNANEYTYTLPDGMLV